MQKKKTLVVKGFVYIRRRIFWICTEANRRNISFSKSSQYSLLHCNIEVMMRWRVFTDLHPDRELQTNTWTSFSASFWDKMMLILIILLRWKEETCLMCEIKDMSWSKNISKVSHGRSGGQTTNCNNTLWPSRTVFPPLSYSFDTSINRIGNYYPVCVSVCVDSRLLKASAKCVT